MRGTLELLYYPFVFVSLIYVLSRIKFNALNLFIVLIFWAGLFNYLGSSIFNLYKIGIVIIALILFSRKVNTIRSQHDKTINVLFLVFSLSFWISYMLQGGGIITILSQYFYKYGLIFLLYHGFKDIQYNPAEREKIKNLLIFILFVQVFLSVIKITIFGLNYEPNVGSMSHGGAGLAVVIPIVGLILFWITKKGKFSPGEWVFLFSLFLISVASGKRAPVILFPLFIFLLLIHSYGKVAVIKSIKYIPLILLLCYAGVRSTPSLNPEGKTWGSFDLNHVISFALRYNFGSADFEEFSSDDYQTTGRGGSFLLLFQPDKIGLLETTDLFFGRGLYEIAVKEQGKFMGGDRYGINHQSLLGEQIKVLYTLGYTGFIFMTLFSVVIIKSVRDKGLGTILLIFYFWEFFLYYNQVVFSNASAIIVVFICFYSNSTDIYSHFDRVDFKKNNPGSTYKNIVNV